MHITIEEYQDLFRTGYRYYFRDCTVRSRRIFTFVIEPELTDEELALEEENSWDSELREKGVRTFIKDRPINEMWSGDDLSGWKELICGASQLPKNQAINMSKDGYSEVVWMPVFVTGSGPAHLEDPIQPASARAGNFCRGAIGNIKTIAGYAYVCGGNRSLAKRIGDSAWESYSHFFKAPSDPTGSHGFQDVDGFSEQDIYLVGGIGDVWHFNGTKAKKLPFPFKTPVYAVCCGGDGQVYVAGLYGAIFVGRNGKWEKVSGVGPQQAIRDMVWHNNRVWCTNDFGVYTIDKRGIAQAELPPEMQACAGNLSVGDGVMLLAGLGGAAYHDGSSWELIVSFAQMDRLLASSQP